MPVVVAFVIAGAAIYVGMLLAWPAITALSLICVTIALLGRRQRDDMGLGVMVATAASLFLAIMLFSAIYANVDWHALWGTVGPSILR